MAFSQMYYTPSSACCAAPCRACFVVHYTRMLLWAACLPLIMTLESYAAHLTNSQRDALCHAPA